MRCSPVPTGNVRALAGMLALLACALPSVAQEPSGLHLHNDVEAPAAASPGAQRNDKAVVAASDFGNIVAMEVSGAYDRGLATPRHDVAQRFYRDHPDEFDFLIAFTTFEYPTGEALAFYNSVRNDVQGIGLDRFDVSAAYGSAGRLQGYIDMAALSRYDFNTRSAAFRSPLNTLTHEIMHRWSVQLHYLDAQGTRRDDLIGRDGAHWSLFADTEASLMYGAQWRQTAPDRWTITEARQRLGAWDMYLAGFADHSEVSDFGVIRSSEGNPADLPRVGLTVTGTQERITSAQVLAAEGARVPSAAVAPRYFTGALLLITRPGQAIDPRDLAKLERFRTAYEQYFQSATGGRASLRLHLRTRSAARVAAPAALAASEVSPRPQPVNTALEWLGRQQRSDGHWQDRAATAARDTTAVVLALREADPQSAALAQGTQWLNGRSSRNLDEHGWIQTALPNRVVAGGAPLNADGGTGVLAEWNSSAADSLRSWSSLHTMQTRDEIRIARMVAFVRLQQNPDGSFAAGRGAAGRIGLSALAADRLLQRDDAAARADGARARDWISARVQVASIQSAAFALSEIAELMLRAASLELPETTRDTLAQYLLSKQGADGDWAGSVYTTAVAALALQRGSRPNLVPLAAVAAPSEPVRGEPARLRLRIANGGGQSAAASNLHWYDGDPQAGGTLLAGPLPVRALLAGDEVVLDTVINTSAMSGTRALHAVLDRDNAIQETREDDNALRLDLVVTPAPAGVDLGIDAGDLELSPAQFTRVPSSVTLRGRLRNFGLQATSQVRVRVLDRRQASDDLLAETRVDVAATGEASFAIALPIARPEAHRLRVVLDPDGEIAESRESNNSADIILGFGEAIDLEALEDSLEFAPTATLGEDTRIKIAVANRGTRDAPATTLVLEVDAGGGNWQVVAEAALSVIAGATVERTLTWRPALEGAQSLRLRADPAGVVAETDENNNQVSFVQQVVRNDAPSLLAIPGSVLVVPDPVLQGAALRVRAGVRNIGNSAATGFDVALFRGDPRSGGVQLGRVRVGAGLSALGETSVEIEVPDYAERGDATLFVHVDAQSEISEANENDNYGIREITALSLADLAIDQGSITLDPAAPVIGVAVTAQVLVSNLGEQTSAPARIQLFELAGGERAQVGDVQIVPIIAPGQTQLIEWTWTFATLAGAQAVSVQIDRDNLVRESDESNNEAALLLDTQSGDAFVTEPYFSPNGDGVRDQTRAIFAEGADVAEVLVQDHAGRQRRRLDQLEPAGNGSVGVVWDGRDDRGRLLNDGRYALLARTAAGVVRGPAYATLDLDRPMALEAVNSENGIYRALPASRNEWQEMPEGTVAEEYLFTVGHDDNTQISMKRGVLRSHALLGGIEPVITPRWLDRYATQNGLISLEPVQLLPLRDGRILIAMHEMGGANRTLLFVQAGGDIDRPGLLATLQTRDTAPLHAQIDLQRVLVGASSGSEYHQLHLASTVLVPVRSPSMDADVGVVAVLQEGVLFSARNRPEGELGQLEYVPFDIMQPQREIIGNFLNYEYHYRVHHLPASYYMLVHTRAYGCNGDGGGEGSAASAGQAKRVVSDETVKLIDIRSGQPLTLHTASTPDPDDDHGGGGSCEKGLAGEQQGSAKVLSLRTFWLEHQREAVVIDHGARSLLRFDEQGRPLGVLELPATLRSGEYEYSSGQYEPDYEEYLGENPVPESNHPSLHSRWLSDTGSRLGVESRYFDADNDALHLTTGEFVFGYQHYTGMIRGDGATDYLRLPWNGEAIRLGGRSAWPLISSADRQNYPRVTFANAAQMSAPPDWPRFIHRNGTLLRRDGRVFVPTRGRTTSSWRYAARVVAASPSQSRLLLKGENATTERTEALFSTLERLTAVLRASGDGRSVQLNGVATDRNFDFFQLDWALVATPDDWNSLVPATREQVRFDDFISWAPPQAGAYLFRLRVVDRAGNRRDRFASSEVALGSPIANVRQNFRAISPNNDGVQDALELRFVVLRPTEQRFSIRDMAGRIIYSQDFSFGVPELGAGTWTWDGRDSGGARAPDGRYRAELSSGFGLRVNVDTVAPQIEASLTQPPPYFDSEALGNTWGKLVPEPLRGRGPIIDFDVREFFAGQAAAPTYQEFESTVVQGAEWRAFVPYGTAEFDDDPDQAVLAANQYVGKRFRVVAVDAAGNRSERPLGSAQSSLLFSHWWYQRGSLRFSATQALPFGRSDDIPNAGGYLVNDPDVPLFAFDLRGELTDLSADELVVAPDGSPQWITRTAAAAAPVNPREVPYAHGHVAQIPFDVSGRQPGSQIALRLRGRYPDGSELTSNALRFTVGGLLLNCAIDPEPGNFAAASYLQEPSIDFLLEIGVQEGASVRVLSRITGEYLASSRLARFPSPDRVSIAQTHGVASLDHLRFRATASDGQQRRRYSAWDDCRSASGGGGTDAALEVQPVFSPVCSATPSGQVRAIVGNVGAQGEHRLYLSSPLSTQTYSQPVLQDGTVVLSTTAFPEGAWRLALQRREVPADPWTEVASDTFPIDRRAPRIEVESPVQGDRICAADTGAPGMAGRVEDERDVGYFLAQRPSGGSAWSTFACDGYLSAIPDVRCPHFVTAAVSNFSGRSPIEFNKSLADLQTDERVELRLSAADWSGANVCETIEVDIDAAVRLEERGTPATIVLPGTQWPAIAPVGAAQFRRAQWFLRARERVDFGVVLHEAARSPGGAPRIVGDSIATLVNATSRFGDIDFSWDGKTGGNVVPDGLYGVRFEAVDDCGNRIAIDRFVQVDATPPDVEITRPQNLEQLRVVTLSVRGRANDLHFGRYNVALSQVGADGPYVTLEEDTHAVPAAQLLAQWPTTGARGMVWVRLQAEDLLGNRSSEVVQVELLERAEILKSARVVPWLFSPNADGRLDETELHLELHRDARLTVRVLDGLTVHKLLANDAATPAGVLTLAWDGRNQQGALLPDGDYVIEVRAADATQPDSVDLQLLDVRLDTAAPVIDDLQPADAHVRCDEVAGFHVDDLHLRSTEAVLQGPAGWTRRLLVDEIGEHTISPFEGLAEGQYTLDIEAYDRAENQSEVRRQALLDCTLPVATLTLEDGGAVPRVAGRTVALRGSATDANFLRYQLELVAAATPNQPILLLQSTNPVEDGEFMRWQPTQPDGAYTLRLSVEDAAGNIGETTVEIEIDGTPPVADIQYPSDGDVLSGGFLIYGIATDNHFARYRVEIATAAQAARDEWSTIGQGDEPVQQSWLAQAVLSIDASLRLRLVVEDSAGLTATDEIGVRIDTVPPPALVLSGTLMERRDVRLEWQPPAIDDLAAVVLSRNGVEIANVAEGTSSFIDRDVPEGELSYIVSARDDAGNLGPPSNAVLFRVDRTPPEVVLFAPAADERIRAIYAVRGVAQSDEDDFAEWDLSVVEGSAEQLLRRSPAEVIGGDLLLWDTRGRASETQVRLRLRARDIAGNEAQTEVRVVIDNEPPAAPVGLAAVNGTEVQVNWAANNEADLLGYLLYRGGELVGFGGSLPADLRPLALADNAYSDVAAPDGELVYRVYAIDQAGNISAPSAPAELERDAGPPRLEIVRPQPDEEFEEAIEIAARSADRDIAQVVFAYRRAGTQDWTAIGAPDTELPWQSTFEPGALAYGDYELRALATDEGGLSDLEPPVVSVRYADLTPPAAPTGVLARANGDLVRVQWNASSEPDLAGYRLERLEADGRWVAVGPATPTATQFEHTGRGEGAHEYRVVALDDSENASEPSAVDRAHVFALGLDVPATPVSDASIDLGGRAQSRAGRLSYQVTAGASNSSGEGGEVAEFAAFELTDVALFLGENNLAVRITDSDGNVSLPASVQVRRGEVPPPPTGLSGVLDGNQVDLSWQSSPSGDVAGYRVYRNNRALWQDTRLAQVLGANDGEGDLPQLIDQNPATQWTIEAEVATAALRSPNQATLSWSARALIGGVRLHFADAARSAADFRIYAVTEYGHLQLLAERRGRRNVEERVLFERPYPTDELVIEFERAQAPGAEVAVSEIEVMERTVITATVYEDSVGDGRHIYEVAALSTLGFASARSTPFVVEVGDAQAPPAVVLSGSVDGDSALLSWTESVAPDLLGYAVLRDGERIAQIPSAQPRTYLDSGLGNGRYVYTLIAEDQHFNASTASNAVALDVAVGGPATPGLDAVTQEGESAALRVRWSMPGGQTAASYRLYASSAQADPQQPYVLLLSLSASEYLHQGLEFEREYWYRVQAIDTRGNGGELSQPRGARVRDVRPPLTPSLTYPARPGLPVNWVEPTYRVCGYTSTDVEVLLARALDPIAAVRSRSGWSYRTLAYASNSLGTTLMPDGRSVFTPAKDDDNRPVWADVDNGLRTESSGMRSPATITHARASRDGRTVVTVSPYGEVHRYRFNEQYDASPYFNGAMHDLATDADANRILIFGDRYPGITNSLWLLATDGYTFNRVVVPGGRSVRAGSLSWQGNRALFADTEGRVYGINVSVATPVPIEIASNATAAGPLPAPFGPALLVAQSAPARVLRFDVDLGTPRVLLDDGRLPRAMAWSPDARLIALRFTDSFEVRDGVTGALLHRFDQDALQSGYTYRLQWSASWQLLLTSDVPGARPQLYSLPGTFCTDALIAAPGRNVIEAVAGNSSGLLSPSSDPIELNYLPPATGTPDLDFDPTIGLFPAVAHLGEGRSMFVRLRNASGGGLARIDGVYARAILRLPDGSERRLEKSGQLQLSEGEELSVPFDLGLMDQLGEYLLQVKADPDDLLAESNEANNQVGTTWQVRTNDLPYLSLAATQSSYAPGQVIEGDVGVFNPGAVFSGEIVMQARDGTGASLGEIGRFPVDALARAQNRRYEWRWIPSSELLAGEYRIHALLLARNGNQIDERELSVELRAESELALLLQPARVRAPLGEVVPVQIGLDYLTGNQLINQGTLRLHARASQGGAEVLLWQGSTGTLLPGYRLRRSVTWNAAQQVLGLNRLRLSFTSAGTAETLEREVEFVPLAETSTLRGELSITPSTQLGLGQAPGVLRISATNPTTAALPATQFRVRVFAEGEATPRQEQRWTVDLAAAGEFLQTEPMNNLASRPLAYAAILDARLAGDAPDTWRALATLGLQAVDVEGPQLTLVSPDAVEPRRAPVPIAVRIIDRHTRVDSAAYRVDGGEWRALSAGGLDGYEALLHGLGDGTHQLTLRARDSWNNETLSGSHAFIVDSTPPTIVIVGVAEGGLYNTVRTPVITLQDVHPDTISVFLDGVAHTAGTSISGEGAHRLEVIGYDRAGNRSDRQLRFTIDRTPPPLAIVSPADGASTLQDAVTVQIASEPAVEIRLQVASYQRTLIADAQGRAVFDAVPLELGINVISARAQDAAGNDTGPLTVQVTRTQQVGELSGELRPAVLQLPRGSDLTLAFDVRNGTTEAFDDLPVRLQAVAADNASLHQETIALDLAAGATASLTRTLAAANWPYGPVTLLLEADRGTGYRLLDSVTIEVVDTQAPVVLPQLPLPGSVVKPPLDLRVLATDDRGVSRTDYRLDGGPWQALTALSDDLYGANVSLADGDYALRFRAIDAAGNIGESVDMPFSADATPPQIQISGIAQGETYIAAVAPQVTVQDAHLGTLMLTLDGAAFTAGSGVETHGAHRFVAVAVDAAGNRTEHSVDFSLDLQAPAVTFVQPQEGQIVAAETLLVVGSTEAGANIRLNVGAFETTVRANQGGVFSAADVPLALGENLIAARATDGAGNQGAPASVRVFRSDAGSSGLRGTITSAPAQVAFGASFALNLQVEERAGIARTALPVRVQLRALGTAQVVVVRERTLALSAGGNSEGSETIDSSTLALGDYVATLGALHDNTWIDLASAAVAIVDAEAPLVSFEAPAPQSVHGGSADVRVRVTDASAIALVQARADGGDWQTMQSQGGERWQLTIPLPREGNVAIEARARDAYDNTSVPVPLSIRVDRTPPVIRIDGVQEGQRSRLALTPVITIEDSTSTGNTVTLDNLTFASGTVVAGHGPHVLHVEARDEAGLSSTRTLRFEIDTEAPVVTLSYPLPGTHVSSTSIDVLGQTEPLAVVELRNGAVARSTRANADGAFVFAAVALAGGDNLILARAIDAVGNIGAYANTNVMRACGTAELACSIFRDGFESPGVGGFKHPTAGAKPAIRDFDPHPESPPQLQTVRRVALHQPTPCRTAMTRVNISSRS